MRPIILSLSVFCAGLFCGSACMAQASAEINTTVTKPVMAKSNEATKEQLAFARAEGDSVSNCLQWLLGQPGVTGGQMYAGEYRITYVFGKPEGWYELSNNVPNWREAPQQSAAHLFVFIQDGADNRIVPPLNVDYSITNAAGNVTDHDVMHFAWTPLVNGYGDNLHLSGSGTYVLNLTIASMPYRRHDPYNGDRFTQRTLASVSIPIQLEQLNQQPLSALMEANTTASEHAGQAFGNTLQEMYKQANDGGDTTIGDYTVAYAVEYAEGYWHYEKAKFRYMQENEMSGKTNAHVEIAVRDAKSGRFMEDLDIHAIVKDKKDTPIDNMKEPFMWHPWLYHYGENWRVPSAGEYTIVAVVQPPAYRRYGKTLGKQFTKPLQVVFNHVMIKSGQK